MSWDMPGGVVEGGGGSFWVWQARLIPDPEETVPGAGGHSHAVARHS